MTDQLALALFLLQLALVPAQVVLTILGKKKRGLRFVAAGLFPAFGLLHLGYERLIPAEANIRVDLLLLYPALLLSLIAAVVALVLALRQGAGDEPASEPASEPSS